MPEILLGSHTITSHGVKVARFHKHDWFILALLGAIELVLYIMQPFHRFVSRELMTDLKYPLKDPTVPFWAVPIICILLPSLIVLGYYYYRRDVYDFHHAILGLLYSAMITGVITDAIKDAVGRPRPDFFWRCFPDGKAAFHPVSGDVICHGLKNVIKEGRKSFPSGHTSWSFAGLGFLSWYLSGKIKLFDREGHVAKLCIVLLPFLPASFVGISLVNDYWHHWQDIFVGGFLGLVIGSLCYLQFFPPPYDANGWGPHAYFRMLEEARAAVVLEGVHIASESGNSNENGVGDGNGCHITVFLKCVGLALDRSEGFHWEGHIWNDVLYVNGLASQVATSKKIVFCSENDNL